MGRGREWEWDRAREGEGGQSELCVCVYTSLLVCIRVSNQTIEASRVG
jgi:hypothetical protein